MNNRDSSTNRQSEISLLGFMTVVLRRRRLVVRIMAVVVVVVATFALLRPRTYTASASFMPQSTDPSGAGVAGLAAQFGVALPAADAGQSPQFYANFLGSRGVLGAIVEATYEFEGRTGNWFRSDSGTVRGTLIDLYDIGAYAYPKRREKAIKRLQEDLSVRTNRETGVVSFSVTALWPPLAERIASRMLELVNTFNMETRRTQAAAERQFVEERLEQVAEELRESENELQQFLQQNRDFADSPSLVFDHDRLQRVVLQRQQVLTSLAQAYEQARIEEVRNTPVITVVESPELPAIHDPRGRALMGLLGIFLGGVLGLVGAFTREFFARSRVSEPNEYGEFVKLKEDTFADIRRFVPRFLRGRQKAV